MSNTINLTIVLDKKDYQAFALHSNGRLRSYLGCNILSLFFVLGLLSISTKLAEATFKAYCLPKEYFTATIFILAFASYLTYHFFFKWLHKPYVTFYSNVKPHDMKCEFSSDNIIMTTENAENKYTWRAIKTISQSKDAIYLMLNELSGYIIPKIQLEEPEAFYAQVEDWFDASCSTQDTNP